MAAKSLTHFLFKRCIWSAVLCTQKHGPAL